MDRRHFLHCLTAASIGAALARGAGRVQPPMLRIGVPWALRSADGAEPPAQSQLGLGAMLGVSEAQHVATLFDSHRVGLVGDPDAAALVRGEHRVAALLGGRDDAEAEHLSKLAAETRTIFVNLRSTADALREGPCRPWVFHVAASDAMRRAARATAGAPDDAPVELWHPALERFGAAQLNDRFRAFSRGEAMQAPAWAAWFAAKALGEAALRTRSVDPATLAAWLASPRARLDGHKGTPLAFGAHDHQLRQPLWVRDAAGGWKEIAAPMLSGETGAAPPHPCTP